MTRTSMRRGRVSPSGTTSPSCSTRSSFACIAGGISPISSSSTVPPAAASKRPRWSWIAPVKAPRRWPNSSLSSRVSGQRGAVDGEERTLGARAGAVDAARHQLLAGAGLALDEHGDRRARGALHEREHRRHRRRASDDVGEAVAPGEVAAQRSHLRPQALLRRLQPRIELGVLEGDGDGCRRALRGTSGRHRRTRRRGG